MKTAISIPDDLYRVAEAFARARGLSRSELYAHALRLYLAANEAERVTAALDEVYREAPDAIDPALKAAQRRIIEREEW